MSEQQLINLLRLAADKLEKKQIKKLPVKSVSVGDKYEAKLRAKIKGH